MDQNSIKSRRKFLEQLGVVGAGLVSIPCLMPGCDSKSNSTDQSNKMTSNLAKDIGVQIYSVRNELNDDLEKTISAVAKLGYSCIEAYGLSLDGKFFGKYTPQEFNAIVTNTGMYIASVHTSYFKHNDVDIFINAALAMDAKHIVIPYLDESLRGDYSSIAENLNRIGEITTSAGIRFGYHNHDFEFLLDPDNRVPMEILINETDPDKVSFQADLYWVRKAGVDPLEFVKKFPGRFLSYHVKDADNNLDQTTVGEGIIPFPEIFELNIVSGLDYLFVEDERTETPLQNIGSALNYLNTL
tara:strand:- start:2586 stop:3482 length:897 start_codon:yes stop_codon:yes gene_type:complete